MKLKKVKGLKPLRNLVAYKWIKVNSPSKYIELADSVHDNPAADRLGHKYTCEVIAIGPDVCDIEPGDWFLMHEYNKVDQGTPWREEDIMFVEEPHILFKINDKKKMLTLAKPITEKMEKEYEKLY